MSLKFISTLAGAAMALSALPVSAGNTIVKFTTGPAGVYAPNAFAYSTSPNVFSMFRRAPSMAFRNGAFVEAGPRTRVLRESYGRAPGFSLKLGFDCVAQGTPVEFPNDIRISNPYDFTTPAGIEVAYAAPYGNAGVVVLPALKPGHGVFVSNAVPGGIPAGAPCSAVEM